MLKVLNTIEVDLAVCSIVCALTKYILRYHTVSIPV